MKRLDVRLLNFETIAHPEIAILTSESNGTVKNSPEMVKSVVAAAECAGVPYKVKPAILGVGAMLVLSARSRCRDTTSLSGTAAVGGLLSPEVGYT
jgi:hypothetical protein